MIKCPKCKKQFDMAKIKYDDNVVYHPFQGEIETTTDYCPYCDTPINAYKQAQRMKSIRKTFHRPTKVVDKDKKKRTRTQIKKDLEKENE